jgi:hypothetical protein
MHLNEEDQPEVGFFPFLLVYINHQSLASIHYNDIVLKAIIMHDFVAEMPAPCTSLVVHPVREITVYAKHRKRPMTTS